MFTIFFVHVGKTISEFEGKIPYEWLRKSVRSLLHSGNDIQHKNLIAPPSFYNIASGLSVPTGTMLFVLVIFCVCFNL